MAIERMHIEEIEGYVWNQPTGLDDFGNYDDPKGYYRTVTTRLPGNPPINLGDLADPKPALIWKRKEYVHSGHYTEVLFCLAYALLNQQRLKEEYGIEIKRVNLTIIGVPVQATDIENLQTTPTNLYQTHKNCY